MIMRMLIESDATSAATICRELDIPFHHVCAFEYQSYSTQLILCVQVTFSRQYMTDVFQVFLQEIRSGLAPNPNVMCNRSIVIVPHSHSMFCNRQCSIESPKLLNYPQSSYRIAPNQCTVSSTPSSGFVLMRRNSASSRITA